MHAKFEHNGAECILTTEHAASSYGIPVVVQNGELTDDYRVHHADASNGRRYWWVHTWDGDLVAKIEGKQWDCEDDRLAEEED